MNNNGKNNDNPFAKNNILFDSINKHFTCHYRQKLIPPGQKMINGILNEIYTTDKCPECPYKDQHAKRHKYRKLFNPLVLLS